MTAQIADLQFAIETKLLDLGWATVARHGNSRFVVVSEDRLLGWAIEVLVKTGHDREILQAQLALVAPARRWWWLRQRLPSSAFVVLYSKLEQLNAAHTSPSRSLLPDCLDPEAEVSPQSAGSDSPG